MFKRTKGEISVLKLEYEVPSPMESLQTMYWNILLYAIITWYLDHILTHNRGTSE